MAITVRNVLELPGLKEFRLAAGEKGLENRVEKTGIVDYEFTEGYPIDKEEAFERNSFVISSLLFAKDDPSLLLGAVKSLIDYGVSALGIKTVFFRELPPEVAEEADRQGFAVFFFDSAYFEDVISDLRLAVEADRVRGREGLLLQTLCNGGLGSAEIRRLAKELHPHLERYVRVYCCRLKREAVDWDYARVLGSFSRSPARRPDTAAFYFRRKLLLFISAEEDREDKYRRRYADALRCAGLSETELTAGESRSHLTEIELDRALREAVCACRCAGLLETDFLPVGRAGVLELLLPQAAEAEGEKGEEARSYAEHYLAPVLQGGRGENDELYKTAAAYVRCAGSIPRTAARLFVHENTVRYRIGRLREKLDPEAGEYVFFQNLSAAVWIKLTQSQDASEGNLF